MQEMASPLACFRRTGLPAGQGNELPEALFKRASQHRTHRKMAAAALQRPSSFLAIASIHSLVALYARLFRRP
jgi:hypothetical protein